jgi:predicted amidohydrolase YtcJ
MQDALPTAEAIAIAGSAILAVGSTREILDLALPSTTVTDLQHGATILPGFIDPHSHLSAYGFYGDAEHWIDVSSINTFCKPLPGDPACKAPSDPQQCFIPVRNQQDVVERLEAAVTRAKHRNPTTPRPVLAFNYDAARLGPTERCGGAGFACRNFEDGDDA